MLTEGHIFTIKTKDPQNVADIQKVATGVIISGLNVLKEQIRIGDFVFVVFGGDRPPWKPGLVGIALVSRAPFDEGYDGKKNFRVGIDIKAYFEPITRGDLVTYPDTFDTIGIGPITKWEPNQAITSVLVRNAKGLLQAICDLRPGTLDAIKNLFGNEFDSLPKDVRRFLPGWSSLSQPLQTRAQIREKSPEIKDCLTLALKMFAARRGEAAGGEGSPSYEECCREIREEWGALDGEKLAACDYAAFRRGLCDQQVANVYFSQHTEADKRWLGDFLAEVRREPKDISVYLANPPQVPGMGGVMLTNCLMRVRPDVYATYSRQMFDAVKSVGLAKDENLPPLAAASYETYKGVQTVIRDRMAELGIGRTSGGDGPADYLTVNEFTWFLSEQKDAIAEEIMKKQWKRVNAQAAQKHGSRPLADAFGGDGMLQRLAAALRTKPFAILAGHSGTGKSRLVRRLAYMTCNDEALAAEGEGRTAPGNYCMVQVKPNWHDSSDLLGYFSEMGGRHFVNTPFVSFLCKAHAHPGTPFFVCLDEMNLAPVEQYFAEYLSAIESMEEKNGVWLTDPLVETERSGEEADPEFLGQVMKGAESVEAAEWIAAHGLTIPKNLFVVGTVNMDETTCQFSRKVLDRAMTLLMTEADFGGMANVRKPSEEELLDDDGIRFFLDGGVRGAVGETEACLLEGLNGPLANTAFAVAYRFANEYALYEAAWAKLAGIDLAAATEEERKQLAETALDHAVLMKLLPRIHGERRIVDVLFNGHKVKGEGGEKNLPGLKDKVPAEGMSAKMMEAILARPDEYLTFWP
jgi:hypothetical protein